ncbi:MAG: L,D-transpeptidase family protein [Tepidanaerobacteraceae bacterium]
MKFRLFIIALVALFILRYFVSVANHVIVQQMDEAGTMRILIRFYIPVRCDDIDEKIELASERGSPIVSNSKWLQDDLLEIIAFETGLPKGFRIKLQIGPISTKIPGVYKIVRREFRPNITPFLMGISEITSKKGPIELNFSTPVKVESIIRGLDCGFDFTLRPFQKILPEGSIFKDYSRLIISPKHVLTAGEKHKIKYEGIIENFAGQRNTKGFYGAFSVADIPDVVSTNPTYGQEDVDLYSPIHVIFDQEMRDVQIQVSNMDGDIELKGKNAVFKPRAVFLPGSTYKVEVRGTSIFDEDIRPYKFNFTTVDIGDVIWVEVNLRPLQKVIVYQGKKAIKSMIASGGLPEPDKVTPLGHFNLKDRGKYFWSERFQEGAYHWVRITDNFLVHSVPRDKDDKIIEEELKKLGIPASHGCIRLKDEDAKWFYDNVPSGSLVIIHD